MRAGNGGERIPKGELPTKLWLSNSHCCLRHLAALEAQLHRCSEVSLVRLGGALRQVGKNTKRPSNRRAGMCLRGAVQLDGLCEQADGKASPMSRSCPACLGIFEARSSSMSPVVRLPNLRLAQPGTKQGTRQRNQSMFEARLPCLRLALGPAQCLRLASLSAQPATTQARLIPARIALPLPRGFLQAHDINWSNDARTCPCLNRHLTSSASCSRTTDAARAGSFTGKKSITNRVPSFYQGWGPLGVAFHFSLFRLTSQKRRFNPGL